MAEIKRVYQLPPLRNGGFTTEQQRALNDVFLQLSPTAGSSGAQTFSQAMTDGAPTAEVSVAQSSDAYVPIFTTTWWTMIKVVSKTASLLTVEFSNPPSAGDVLEVVIP